PDDILGHPVLGCVHSPEVWTLVTTECIVYRWQTPARVIVLQTIKEVDAPPWPEFSPVQWKGEPDPAAIAQWEVLSLRTEEGAQQRVWVPSGSELVGLWNILLMARRCRCWQRLATR